MVRIPLLTAAAVVLLSAAPATANVLDPISLLSGSSATAGGNDYTFGVGSADVSEAITPDGRYVAFSTLASNLPTAIADANSSDDVVWEDLQTGQIKLVSVNATGAGAANGDSVRPSISDDGRYVAFDSTATNLVTGFTDGNSSGGRDVYLRDIQSSTTSLLSRPPGSAPTGGNGRSLYPLMSGNGHGVVWWGKSSNTETPDIHAGGALPVFHILVRDLTAATTQFVDVNAGATDVANGDGGYYAITTDARYVAFVSEGSNLVAGFSNPDSGVDSVYRRDLQNATTVLASPSSAGPAVGASGTSDGYVPAISDDGRFIAFQSGAA